MWDDHRATKTKEVGRASVSHIGALYAYGILVGAKYVRRCARVPRMCVVGGTKTCVRVWCPCTRALALARLEANKNA